MYNMRWRKKSLPSQVDKQVEAVSDLSSSKKNSNIETFYNLVRDREMRTIKPHQRYGQANFLAFALTMTEEVVQLEPKTCKEAMSSKETDH